MTELRLTRYTQGGGCASKIASEDLAKVLGGLPRSTDPRVLAGNDGFEDAGAVAVAADLAIVQTVDFFAPVVDDPGDFARIAAANAISDIYAMGAMPLVALALVAWPQDLPGDALAELLAAGIEKASEAGCSIIGGHSIVDAEPKYGLAVTGTCAPGALWRNSGARPGDVLFLTKPLGAGIVARAIKREVAPPDVERAAIGWMSRLNRDAAEAAHTVGPSAATDVTGFGLVGHAHELASASGLAIEIDSSMLELYAGVVELAEADVIPGGSKRNRAAADRYAAFAGDLGVREIVVCDAQTSGGLLLAVSADRADDLAHALAARSLPARAIGRCVAGPGGRITVS